MMHFEKIAILRTQLREVNIEFSALVRTKGGEDRFVRMDELKARRQTLMALIAKTPLQALPGKAPLNAVVQAA